MAGRPFFVCLMFESFQLEISLNLLYRLF